MSPWLLTRVFLRSLLLQAVFNYERMQNVGFAYAMSPALAQLYEGEALSDALKRHLERFNCHPYLSAYALGAAINMEEQIARGELPPEMVVEMKRSSMTGLAAVGDNFFWSSLRPFLAVWAVGLMLMEVYWAPIFFLVLYNVVHLSIRISAFISGYKNGIFAIQNLGKMNLPSFADYSQFALAAGMAFFATVITHKAYLSDKNVEYPLDILFYFVTAGIFILAIKRKIPISLIFVITTVLIFMFISALNKMFPLI